MEESWMRCVESIWREVAKRIWWQTMAGVENTIRESCWKSVPELKIVESPKGWIIAHRELNMHLNAYYSTVPHITDHLLKRKRWLPEINSHSIWFLDPRFALSCFESCKHERLSLLQANAEIFEGCRNNRMSEKLNRQSRTSSER
jgi:hypothetical protein